MHNTLVVVICIFFSIRHCLNDKAPARFTERTCLTVGVDVVAVTLTRVAVDVINAGAAVLTR